MYIGKSGFLCGALFVVFCGNIANSKTQMQKSDRYHPDLHLSYHFKIAKTNCTCLESKPPSPYTPHPHPHPKKKPPSNVKHLIEFIDSSWYHS